MFRRDICGRGSSQKKNKIKAISSVADGGDLRAPFTTPSPWDRSRASSFETDPLPMKYTASGSEVGACAPIEVPDHRKLSQPSLTRSATMGNGRNEQN
ncbi:hypothetical protein NP493_341g02012 [Ridgeia piscesae]|uniref:Uncharacterized protein n=1 Tax=Ridgeia piscesae TaxID=27915 RepID=A0AAD9L3H7_RIDPI|nr:hypothetical protein NP493_341g02012 [Ridgeia piscesae]